MAVINISITDKRPTVHGSPVIVCGNSDYTLSLSFDAEWNTAGAMTARFVYIQGGEVKYQDVPFTGATVSVPVLSNTKEVRVGIYAGNLQTSTPAVIPCEQSIRCGTAAPTAPTPSQYDQIIKLLQLNNTAIAGIQVGGRNLITNSAFGQGARHWLLDAGCSVDTTTKRGANSTLKIAASGYTANAYIGAQHLYTPEANAPTLSAGESVILSFDYFIPSLEGFDSALYAQLLGFGEGATAPQSIQIGTVALSDLVVGAWTSYRHQINIGAAYTNCHPNIYISRNGTLWLANIKLERGTIPTDWTPAPEDILALEERVAALEASLLAMGGEI